MSILSRGTFAPQHTNLDTTMVLLHAMDYVMMNSVATVGHNGVTTFVLLSPQGAWLYSSISMSGARGEPSWDGGGGGARRGGVGGGESGWGFVACPDCQPTQRASNSIIPLYLRDENLGGPAQLRPLMHACWRLTATGTRQSCL